MELLKHGVAISVMAEPVEDREYIEARIVREDRFRTTYYHISPYSVGRLQQLGACLLGQERRGWYLQLTGPICGWTLILQ